MKTTYKHPVSGAIYEIEVTSKGFSVSQAGLPVSGPMRLERLSGPVLENDYLWAAQRWIDNQAS